MRQIAIALRRLRREPAFAAAAVGVLTLGIAAPTALFAVVQATLLRPLPYTRANEIYTVRTTMTDGRFTIGLVASAEMNALRQTTDLVVQSALTRRDKVTLTTDAGVRQLIAYTVSPGFFDLFGARMAGGRPFNDEDLKSPMGSRVVLAHRAWVSLFGSDPGVVGRTIRLGDGPGSLVVGIAPETFAIPRDADLYAALPADNSIGHIYDAYVRLAPGVTPEIVQPRLTGMWAELARQYPDQAKNRVFVMRPLLDAIVGDLRPFVVMAFVATGLLLLLAIVNVANLLLARGTARAREMALRTALGATRRDLFAHAISESLLIAGVATAIAIPIASGAIRAIVVIGGSALPRADGIRLDAPVFLFAAAVMIVGGLLVGLAPLLTTSAGRVATAMNEGGRAALQGRTTRRVLAGMVVAEIALAIALVSGAGRLLLSMRNLVTIDPGFTAEGRLAIDVALPARPYLREPARLFSWLEQAEARLRALGATEVGVASSLPLRREADSTTFVDITGRPTDPASRPNGRLRIVNPGFFRVMNISIVAGRPFTPDDRFGGDPVVVVNEAWARKFLGGLDPLRERVSPGPFGRRVDGKYVPLDAAIVGVAKDVSYAALTAPAEPIVYVSTSQVIRPDQTLIITTADGWPERLIPQIRTELAAVDPAVPIGFESMAQAVSNSLTWPRMGVLLMATFGIAGLVLAASGVFGVVAFVAAQRSGEMAVRIALGATGSRIFRLVLAQAATLALGGLGIGVLLAWWMGVSMAAYVHRVTPANPLVLAGSALLVVAVAFAATLPSARRAAATEPARVLRS
jgi:putative ABC transport system permease protein